MLAAAAIVLVLSGTPGAAFTKAEALTTERKFDEAEKVVRESMKQNPAAHGHHLALGKVLLARGKVAEAYYEYFYEVLRAGKEPPAGDAVRAGKALLENNRGVEVDEIRRLLKGVDETAVDPVAARKTLQAVEKERPPRFVLRFFLAETRLRSGDHEQALQEARALTTEDAHFAPAVVIEAMALRALGKQREAEGAAARAREIAPSHWCLAPLALLAQPMPTPPPTPAPPPSPAPSASAVP